MFWCIWNDIIVNKNFNFDYQVPYYDQHITHIFKNGEYYDGICLFSKNKTVSKKEFKHRFFTEKKEVDIQASVPKKYDQFNISTYDEYLKAIETSTTEMFWGLWKDVVILNEDIFEMYFSHHNVYDKTENHVFKNIFRKEETYTNGIVLFSKNKLVSQREISHRFLIEKKEYETIASRTKPYDIVFISYNEPTADENYSRLIEKFPRAKRVHGVKGIHQAHIKAAEFCETDMFWVVDGDAVLEEDFYFDHEVSTYERDIVHVWRSKNPINDLIYGYGGVKLLPRKLTLSVDVNSPDMTTSISKKFKSIQTVSNVTYFNTDPFNTWKSAFRECVKLSSKIIDRQKDNETQERLHVWMTVGSDRPYGQYAVAGAKIGYEYGKENANDPQALSKINDFDWLKRKFDEI